MDHVEKIFISCQFVDCRVTSDYGLGHSDSPHQLSSTELQVHAR